MKSGRRVPCFAALQVVVLLLFTSCSKEPAPKIDGLSFPVVMLFGNASTRVCNEPAELTTMHTNYIVLNQQDPTLIDANFKIFAVYRLRSVNGGGWLIANPSALTDVTFELKPQKSGRDAARALFAQHLEKQTWLHDRDVRRVALRKEEALLGMAALMESSDD